MAMDVHACTSTRVCGGGTNAPAFLCEAGEAPSPAAAAAPPPPTRAVLQLSQQAQAHNTTYWRPVKIRLLALAKTVK